MIKLLSVNTALRCCSGYIGIAQLFSLTSELKVPTANLLRINHFSKYEIPLKRPTKSNISMAFGIVLNKCAC